MAIRNGLAKCSSCGGKDTHRGLYGFEMELNPRWGKITNLGVTKWVCNDCGHEDSDSTIIGLKEERKKHKEVKGLKRVLLR